MSTATTTKPIDPNLLKSELGADVVTRGGWPASADPKVIEANVSQATLDAAIAGHTFDPAARTNTEQQIDTLLDEALAGLQAIIDAPQVSFTTLAQAQAAVRQLQTAVVLEARVLRRLVRLRRGNLTGTD